MLTKITVILGFVISFGAGLAVGTRALPDRPGPHGPPPSTRGSGGPMGGWMTKELNLTADQQEQLKKIWEQAGPRGRGHELDDRRNELRKQRDEAIASLIRPEDKAAFDQVNKTYSDQRAALDAQMRDGFTKAVEQTKRILTPEQRDKYEAMLKRFEPERGPRDHGRPPRERGTTQPATNP